MDCGGGKIRKPWNRHLTMRWADANEILNWNQIHILTVASGNPVLFKCHSGHAAAEAAITHRHRQQRSLDQCRVVELMSTSERSVLDIWYLQRQLLINLQIRVERFQHLIRGWVRGQRRLRHRYCHYRWTGPRRSSIWDRLPVNFAPYVKRISIFQFLKAKPP